MKLVITGGHHSSALPIINKIKSQNLDIEVFWFGHKHSLSGDKNTTLEYREITALNIPFYELNAGKFYKSFNLKNLLKLPYGLFQSLNYLRKVKPDLILSFGGYLAAPVVLAGWLLKIPSITHEQTVAVGYANRFVSHFAKKIMISWKESEKFFPKEKVVFTGIPLRESIYKSSTHFFDVENTLPFIYFSAGKSGSVKINKAVMEALPQLLMFANVIHQTGDYSVESHHETLSTYYEKIKNALPGKYFVEKFIFDDKIGEAYSKSTLVVCRAGAHTVSEIMALEKPALLIPIPWVSHNEQYQNAMVIKNAGLGEILPEKDLTAEAILEKIKYMLHNKDSYHRNTASNFKDVCDHAADLILNEVLKYAIH